MTLRRQLAIARAWLPLLAASMILAGACAYLASGLLAKEYEAKTTLIVGQSLSAANPDYSQLLVSQRLSTTYASVATTRPVLEATIRQLGLDITPESLAPRLLADAPFDSTLLAISARDTDPGRAAAIANSVADQLIAASPTIQGRQAELQKSIDAQMSATQRQIDATQAGVDGLTGLNNRTPAQEAQLQTLEGRLVSLRSTYASLLSFSSGNAANLVSVVERAVAPSAPVSPRPLLNALIGSILGLLVAAGVAFVVECLDDAVKSPEDVQEVAGLDTLGTVSRIRGEGGSREIYRLVTLLYPRSGAAEAYRTLRSNIGFASVDVPLRTLLITSASPGEGKTVTAANLAVAFAQAGLRVLLVDADLRKPNVHVIFDLSNARGLTSLLRSDDETVDGIAQPTEQPNLRVVTSGPLPPNPAELLGSQRMRAILTRLVASAGLIILDSPPLEVVADSAILASFLDGSILVVDARRSHRGMVRRAREALAKADARVLGVVINRTPTGIDTGYADYYGGVGSAESSAALARSAQGSAGRLAP